MSTNTLRIDGELTIFRAAELAPQLLATPVLTQIDLSGVTELDTAGLQLLMMAKQHAQASGAALSLINHSPAVIDVFELLNVAAFFGDHLVMDPQVSPQSRSSHGT